MEKRSKGIVIAASKASALELTALAEKLCGSVEVIAVGDREAAVNAEKAYYIDTTGTSFIAAVGSMKKVIAESGADTVIVELSKNGRYAAACIAAANGTAAVTDAADVWGEDGKIYAKRMVYGGGAFKTVCVPGFAVICPVAGIAAAEEERPCASVEEFEAAMPEGVEYVSASEKTVQKVNLAVAKRIVGVGRGIKNAENLAIAEDFAGKIGAELGCTRPVAEDDGLMARERYIGVSGVTVKPELYIAAGISGQIQHMVGVGESGTIIAINKDKQAPIFQQCDLGIVGDVLEVMKAIEEKL